MADTNLARLRKQAGLSQAQLAAMVDSRPAWISNYETGARDISKMTLGMAAKLAHALGIHAEGLLNGNPS